MTRLGLLRHGPTLWNAEHRLQGRSEVPLSTEARAHLANARVPTPFGEAVWHTSPLARAHETARLLGGKTARVEPRLIEMDFGAFEGWRLDELRREHGEAMRQNEARGLDFQPPGGESPRQVQARLRPWLEACAAEGGDHFAVTHKGVIRAILALACDWQMRCKPPLRLDWQAVHVFALDASGRPLPLEMNVSLERR